MLAVFSKIVSLGNTPVRIYSRARFDQPRCDRAFSPEGVAGETEGLVTPRAVDDSGLRTAVDAVGPVGDFAGGRAVGVGRLFQPADRVDRPCVSGHAAGHARTLSRLPVSLLPVVCGNAGLPGGRVLLSRERRRPALDSAWPD